MENVKQQGLLFKIYIPPASTRTKVAGKSFVTSEEVHPILDKYIKLRPEGMQRFLVQYRNKKCTRQNVGKRTLTAILQDVAKFLNLLDIQLYTGHGYRRTSATFLVDEGADLLQLKRHGGWKSSTVAESYIDESDLNKQRTSKLISYSINIQSRLKAEPSNVLLEKKINNRSVSKQNVMKLSQVEKEAIDVITQAEYEEVLFSDFEPPKKKLKKKNIVIEDMENLSQEKLTEIITTDFYEKKEKKEKPIFIFKKSNITINN
ncbi:uncharacterized protein LOC107271399 [Cephus cinctus]|uniref:Uncharacterized protein LOC107271399 n=1 Tax=Cephus cinctus TaxID=211228 RepID=A0AAJ7RNW8_CEPCN|nr:uncharacterized protein LOC107271399 [Cephus cinctus]